MSEAPVVQAKAFAADLGFVEGPVVRGDNVVCTRARGDRRRPERRGCGA
jgi:hypothetical protein